MASGEQGLGPCFAGKAGVDGEVSGDYRFDDHIGDCFAGFDFFFEASWGGIKIKLRKWVRKRM